VLIIDPRTISRQSKPLRMKMYEKNHLDKIPNASVHTEGQGTNFIATRPIIEE